MVPLRILAPLVAVFALFLAMLANSVLRPRAPVEPDAARRGVRGLAVTILGGYAVFLAVVLVFHVALAGEHGALGSAVTEGALLAVAVAAPAFLALSWRERKLRRRASGGR